MKVVFNLLASLVMIICLASCSKKQGASTASFDLNFTAITTNDYQGGMLIVGHSLDDRYNFSMSIVPGQGIPTLDLQNGQWEFFISYWSGPQLLEGDSRCGYSGIYDLKGSDTSISFTISQAACSTAIDAQTNPSTLKNLSGGFPAIDFQSCLTIDPSQNGAASCLNQGLTTSYRVSLESETKGVEGISSTALRSSCYQVNSGANLSLPSGDTFGGSIFSARVELYTSDDCTLAPVIYDFRDGLLNGVDSQELVSTIDYTSTNYTTAGVATVYIEHNTQTPVGFKDPILAAFGDGRDGDTSGTMPTMYNDYLSAISTDGHTITAAAAPWSIGPGDELLWHVVNDSCGANFRIGHYGFLRVKSISGMTIETFNSMTNGDASVIPSDFSTCRIQVQKVYNFNNFTMSSNTITPSQIGADLGGIMAFRVKDTLLIDSQFNTVGVSATGKGYMNPLAANTYDHCGPGECLKIGGGDGSTGYGGGAVLVFAKNIVVKDPSDNPIIFKSGGTGAASSDGGEVVVMTKTIDIQTPALSFDRNILYADGASAGSAGYTNFLYCDDISSGSGSFVSTSSVGGAANLSDFISLQGNADYCQY